MFIIAMRIINVYTLLTLFASFASSSMYGYSIPNSSEDNQLMEYVFKRVPWTVHNSDLESVKNLLHRYRHSRDRMEAFVRYAYRQWRSLPMDIKDLIMETFAQEDFFQEFKLSSLLRDLLRNACRKAKWLQPVIKLLSVNCFDLRDASPKVFKEVLSTFNFAGPLVEGSEEKALLHVYGSYGLTAEQVNILVDKISKEKSVKDAFEHAFEYPIELWGRYVKEDIEAQMKVDEALPWPVCAHLLKNYLHDTRDSIRQSCLRQLSLEDIIWYNLPEDIWDYVPAELANIFVEKIDKVDPILRNKSPNAVRGFLTFADKHGVLQNVYNRPKLFAMILFSGVKLNGKDEIEPYIDDEKCRNVLNRLDLKYDISEFVRVNKGILPEYLRAMLSWYDTQYWKKKLTSDLTTDRWEELRNH